MGYLLGLLPGILIMALLLWFACRRFQRMQPQVMLEGVPQDVENGLVDETPEARGFWKHYAEFVADFERAGHPFQYRQLVDLLACGPWGLTVAASRDLLLSRHLGRYASDLELRNELGEITAHNLRRVTTRDELRTLNALFERLVDLGGHNEEALGVWLGAALDHDLTGDSPRRRALAVYVVTCSGTPEMVERVRAAAEPDPLLQAEYTRAHEAQDGGGPLPDDNGATRLPCFAEWLQQQGAAEPPAPGAFAKPTDPAADPEH